MLLQLQWLLLAVLCHWTTDPGKPSGALAATCGFVLLDSWSWLALQIVGGVMHAVLLTMELLH